MAKEEHLPPDFLRFPQSFTPLIGFALGKVSKLK